MIYFKNNSGVQLEVRHAIRGGRLVEADEVIEIDAKLHEETDDAYVLSRSVVERDAEGKLIDAEQLTAWPKATWEKTTKKAAETDKKDEEK